MKIFEVDSDRAVPQFYAGKTEAMKIARECAAGSGESVIVYACTLIPGKAGVVALANGPGWQQSSEIVYTAKPRKSRKELIQPALDEDDVEGLM